MRKLLSTGFLSENELQKLHDLQIEVQTISFIEKIKIPFFIEQKYLTNIVFTSHTAIRIFKEYIATFNNFKANVVFVISEKAKNEIMPFAEKILVSESPTAESISETIIASNIRNIAFFCGKKRLSTIEDSLRKNNINCAIIEVYNTKLLNKKISENYDYIYFTSPSNIEAFLLNNEFNPEKHYLAKGKTTLAFLCRYTKSAQLLSDFI